MVPEIVTAVATLIFFAFIGINLGLINVMIAHTVFVYLLHICQLKLL